MGQVAQESQQPRATIIKELQAWPMGAGYSPSRYLPTMSRTSQLTSTLGGRFGTRAITQMFSVAVGADSRRRMQSAPRLTTRQRRVGTERVAQCFSRVGTAVDPGSFLLLA